MHGWNYFLLSTTLPLKLTGWTLPCSHWILLFLIMINYIPDHPSLVLAFVWAWNMHLKLHPGLSCSQCYLIQNVKTIRKIISIWRGGNAVGSTLLPQRDQQRERSSTASSEKMLSVSFQKSQCRHGQPPLQSKGWRHRQVLRQLPFQLLSALSLCQVLYFLFNYWCSEIHKPRSLFMFHPVHVSADYYRFIKHGR